jgi:MFS family permease
LSPELAASFLGIMAAVAFPSRLLGGWFGDRYDKRYVMCVYLGMSVIALILLSRATSAWHALAFIVVYAPAYGGGGPLMPAMIGEYFGRRFFGTINGFAHSLMTVGTALGPIFAGWIFDVTGSYRMAFLVFALLCGIAMGLALAAKRPNLVSA